MSYNNKRYQNKKEKQKLPATTPALNTRNKCVIEAMIIKVNDKVIRFSIHHILRCCCRGHSSFPVMAGSPAAAKDMDRQPHERIIYLDYHCFDDALVPCS